MTIAMMAAIRQNGRSDPGQSLSAAVRKGKRKRPLVVPEWPLVPLRVNGSLLVVGLRTIAASWAGRHAASFFLTGSAVVQQLQFVDDRIALDASRI